MNGGMNQSNLVSNESDMINSRKIALVKPELREKYFIF